MNPSGVSTASGIMRLRQALAKEARRIRSAACILCEALWGSISSGEMTLKPAGFSDAPFFGEILRDAGILKTSGTKKPIAQSTLLLWWWLKKTYIRLYRIDVASTRIGFIGLCSPMPDESAEITLVIFQERHRRVGYGTMSFSMFMWNLQRYSFVKRLIARVTTDNHAALSFWTKLGFSEVRVNDNVAVMSMDLKSGRGAD